MYRVFLERAAEKDLKDLPLRLHNRIITSLQALAKNPRPSGCRKLSGSDKDWRIRVGDYRIVYEIDDAAEIVRVNRVRHRREIVESKQWAVTNTGSDSERRKDSTWVVSIRPQILHASVAGLRRIESLEAGTFSHGESSSLGRS